MTFSSQCYPIFTVMGTSDQIMDLDAVVDFINRLTTLGNENMFELKMDGHTKQLVRKVIPPDS